MAVIELNPFVELLAESQLISERSMRRLREALERASRPVSSQEVADQLVKRGDVTRWQADRLLAGASSFRLGNYKLLEPIGEGGMGTVFKAEHAVMGRLVAVKILLKAKLDNPQALARFKREVKAAAALDHPNVVTAHDAGQQDHTHFLVMEYVDGLDLNTWCKRFGRPSIAWCCEIIRQAAMGLEHAHGMGLIHRDLKPANLLISWPDSDGRPLVKISDLGLARFARARPPGSSQTRALDDDSGVFSMPSAAQQAAALARAALRRADDFDDGVTEAGSIVGTPNFLSPEQVRGEPIDIRSDVFALGCTLFKLLTGQFPFGGQTIMEKLQTVANPAAPPAVPLRKLAPSAPAALEAVVAKLLAHDREQRYQTPKEVAKALTPFIPARGAPSSPEDIIARGDETSFVLQEEEDEPPTHGSVDTGLMRFLEHLPAKDEPSNSATPSATPASGRLGEPWTATTAPAPATPNKASSKESNKAPRRPPLWESAFQRVPAFYWAVAALLVVSMSIAIANHFLGSSLEVVSPKPGRPGHNLTWPTGPQELVFAWRNAHAPMTVADPTSGRSRPCRVNNDYGARFSYDGEMEFSGGEKEMITADEFAQTLLDACSAEHEITIEARITPNDLSLGGPAPIVSFSSGVENRNVTLGQEGDQLVFQLRTNGDSGLNADKHVLAWHQLVSGQPVHVAITYRDGVVEGYIDGRPVYRSEQIKGTFATWSTQHLVFGNEWNGRRPWKGRLSCVALFARRLTPQEIAADAKAAHGR